MKKVFTLTAIILIQMTFVFSVSPNNNKRWYFGANAGIDFNANPVAALTDGALVTFDNTATMSDDNGQLLFYTNGETIWNSQHQIMQNGSGLMGDVTGGQPALIVPRAESNEYYVFTVPEYSSSAGLRYSVVDISLNGGMGGVTIKNVLLNTPSCEKLAAIYNLSNASFWIVAHEYGNANFESYRLDAAGLDSVPVISNTGDSNTGGNYGSIHGGVGQLTFSPDGTHLANAMNLGSKIQVFDFSKTTGIVSNPIDITGLTSAWGVAFSPDGSKLYATRWTYAIILQYDLSSNNAATINSTMTTVGQVTSPDPTYKAGYLQLGQDGKIYIAKYNANALATISNPDAAGALCNFNDAGFYLAGKLSRVGLGTSVVYPGSITGMDKISYESISSTIYPNPSINTVSITSEIIADKDFNLEIIDEIGKSYHVSYTVSGHTISFSLADLSSGYYYYTLTSRRYITKGKILSAK